MEYVSHNAGEVDKVSKVQQQVSEVKEIMMDNIEKVLDRGEKIELLVDKTENLRVRIVFPKSQDCLLPLCDYLLCTTYITSALFYLSAGDCLFIHRDIQYTRTQD